MLKSECRGGLKFDKFIWSERMMSIGIEEP